MKKFRQKRKNTRKKTAGNRKKKYIINGLRCGPASQTGKSMKLMNDKLT